MSITTRVLESTWLGSDEWKYMEVERLPNVWLRDACTASTLPVLAALVVVFPSIAKKDGERSDSFR